jgi:hypothetical protein
MYHFNWKESGNGRNHFIEHRGNMVVLVYRIDAEEKKKLNKETKKYELIAVPEKWIFESRIDYTSFQAVCASVEEAKEWAEKWLADTLDNMSAVLSTFKGVYK